MRGTTRLVVAAAAALLSLNTVAHAGSPIFAGPGYVAGAGGFQQADSHITNWLGYEIGYHGVGMYGPSVNDRGVSVGYARAFGTNGSAKGTLGVSWTANGAAPVTLPALPTNTTNQFTYPTAYAWAVNNTGNAVGYSYHYNSQGQNTGDQAVRWSGVGTASPTITTLGTLTTNDPQSGFTRAYSINDAGVAVGFSPLNGSHRPVLWPANSVTPIRLGDLGLSPGGGTPITTGEAFEINAGGSAAGWVSKYSSTGGSGRAVRWNASAYGTAVELAGIGATPDASQTMALHINNAGAVAGYANKRSASGADLGNRAVRWDAGQTAVTELGTLAPNSAGFVESFPFDINNAGVVVGQSNKYTTSDTYYELKAVRWDAGQSAATELPPLVSSDGGLSGSSHAYAINDSNAIVGDVDAYDRFGNTLGNRAVVWRGDGAVIDLNTRLSADSGWLSLLRANAISETGFVSGIGKFGDLYNWTLRHFTMLVPDAGTYGRGDGDFDGDTDFNDLLVLATHYGKPSGGSLNAGDFDLDGVTDFSDLLTLARNYHGTAGAQLASLTNDAFAADFALAQSLVPEPVTMLSAASMLLIGRRRR